MDFDGMEGLVARKNGWLLDEDQGTRHLGTGWAAVESGRWRVDEDGEWLESSLVNAPACGPLVRIRSWACTKRETVGTVNSAGLKGCLVLNVQYYVPSGGRYL